MKRVFLSADDFGRSKERNKAIDESFKRGLIKSSGLIVTGKYLYDAVTLINRGGYVKDIHLHFNLSGNIKNEDSYDVPLTPEMREDDFFCSGGLFRTFDGLPNKPTSVFKFGMVYRELVAQYNKFLEVTAGEGNLWHVDFHLWYNLTWPVSIALNLFTWTHRIKSVRYIGVHQEKSRRRLFRILSWNPLVKSYRSSNIDGYLTHPEWFEDEKVIELYCHPDYVANQLQDNSISFFGNDKKLLENNLNQLKQNFNLEFLSWSEE